MVIGTRHGVANLIQGGVAVQDSDPLESAVQPTVGNTQLGGQKVSQAECYQASVTARTGDAWRRDNSVALRRPRQPQLKQSALEAHHRHIGLGR
eukprot:846413-Pyramimonas_sp.AAC.1